ncbi:MAG: hypothetical protein NTW04_03325 [Elusimicrobia bacterium]|nr:hypothetical protein [Elusimicrobiota bacterium]
MPADVLIQGMKMEVGKMYGHLCAMSARVEDLRARGQHMLRQLEKYPRQSPQDAAYEADFAHIRNGMRILSTRVEDFHHFAIRAGKLVKIAPKMGNAAAMARGFVLITRRFRLEIEKLSNTLVTARPVFRRLPITLYWWDIDKVVGELYKSSALILDISKEINEYVLNKTGG